MASGGTSLTPDQLRLIKKYTNNLTIIYDGDGAGIKAALRGLDLALEESLNVKLVLIPDKEDPDSYVNKVGAAAFSEFIAANKKDFILFQLETSLQDVGTDTTKKSALVNRVAETISKINKAEDFTKQDAYIKQCAQLLKIDKGGLHTLVNKFIREKITKEENRINRDESFANTDQQTDNYTSEDDDAAALLNKDEQYERAMVRSLLEFGLKDWDEEKKVAEYFFEEITNNDLEELIENKNLISVIHTYKVWYQEGLEPTPKTFLYHEDMILSSLVVGLMDYNYEISPNWKKVYDGKIFSRDELYKEEVFSTLNYLKLRKIKRMIEANQLDLENAHIPEEQMLLLQTHQHLKTIEIELTKQLGTVIFK